MTINDFKISEYYTIRNHYCIGKCSSDIYELSPDAIEQTNIVVSNREFIAELLNNVDFKHLKKNGFSIYSSVEYFEELKSFRTILMNIMLCSPIRWTCEYKYENVFTFEILLSEGKESLSRINERTDFIIDEDGVCNSEGYNLIGEVAKRYFLSFVHGRYLKGRYGQLRNVLDAFDEIEDFFSTMLIRRERNEYLITVYPDSLNINENMLNENIFIRCTNDSSQSILDEIDNILVDDYVFSKTDEYFNKSFVERVCTYFNKEHTRHLSEYNIILIDDSYLSNKIFNILRERLYCTWPEQINGEIFYICYDPTGNVPRSLDLF